MRKLLTLIRNPCPLMIKPFTIIEIITLIENLTRELHTVTRKLLTLLRKIIQSNKKFYSIY